MKRWISKMMVVPVVLGLFACSSTSTDVPKETQAAATSSAPSETVTYVTVEETKTDCGILQVPQINETVLNSEDVKLANEMFLSIQEYVLGLVDEYVEYWGSDIDLDPNDFLYETRTFQNETFLSVNIRYTALSSTYVSTDYYEAINIDLTTGKAMDPQKVIQAAGFTEDEVKNAIRCFGELYKYHEWEQNTYLEQAYTGVIPTDLGDPSNQWQNYLDELVANYDASEPLQGNAWESLPLYPGVYAENSNLEVRVKVPSEAGVGHFYTMVCVGHNNNETIQLNPNQSRNMPFPPWALLPSEATAMVAQRIGLDASNKSTDGVQYNLEATSMEVIHDDVQGYPAYDIRVYIDEGDHIATFNWYAVDVFGRNVWEMDLTTAEWNLMPE